MKPDRKPTAYQRIVRNAKRQSGVLLTPDEVQELSRDVTIDARALHDDEELLDMEVARGRLEEIRRDPKTLVTGVALNKRLNKLTR